MAKQRGHGEGSIYQRKDGRWAASLTLEGGKRRTFYGKTRKQAYDKLKRAQHELQQGMLATGPKQTVKQYLEYWLEEVHKLTVKPATYIKYRSLLNRHVLPVLGHVQLQKLSQEHVQSLYTLKQKEGLSAKTIRLVHGILHKALDDAVRWERINRNVCDLVSQPRPVRYEIQALNAEQAHKLLEVVKGEHRLEGILMLALVTGARRGEILALRWHDVDLEQRTLQIRRTVARLQGLGYVETEPKTVKGMRQIILPDIVIDVLRRQRIYQNEARLKAGVDWQDKDLIFSNKFGGYLDPSKYYSGLKYYSKRQVCPIYAFMTCATLLQQSCWK
jgi:integrase